MNMLFRRDHVPWIGISVTITQIGNPLKGYSGVVKNVLRGQQTVSGLKIEMQLAHLDPSSPFRTVLVDHDHIVETS
jgi:hypothetical protein